MPRAATITKFLAAAAAAASVAACALIGPSHLDGLSLASVGVVPAVTVPGTQCIVGFGTYPPRCGVFMGEMIVIHLRSQRNLRAFAVRYGYTVADRVSLCAGGNIDEARLLQNNPYVFDERGVVDFGDTNGNGAADYAGTYDIYVVVESVPLRGQAVYRYDLRQRVEDICIRLSGGAMVGGHYRSDIVVVPAAAIRDALAHSN